MMNEPLLFPSKRKEQMQKNPIKKKEVPAA
jgi:hypothetical protein